MRWNRTLLIAWMLVEAGCVSATVNLARLPSPVLLGPVDAIGEEPSGTEHSSVQSFESETGEAQYEDGSYRYSEWRDEDAVVYDAAMATRIQPDRAIRNVEVTFDVGLFNAPASMSAWAEVKGDVIQVQPAQAPGVTFYQKAAARDEKGGRP